MTNELSSNTYQLHTCSYYCHHAECIKAQRDYLRDRILELEKFIEDQRLYDKPQNMIGLV